MRSIWYTCGADSTYIIGIVMHPPGTPLPTKKIGQQKVNKKRNTVFMFSEKHDGMQWCFSLPSMIIHSLDCIFPSRRFSVLSFAFLSISVMLLFLW